MGAVYLAREPFLDRSVAVKVLHGDVVSGDARERFLREARTAARLSHPHIVPLYTFGQAGGLLYYVMGFVDGESLGARLTREGRLSPGETRRIASELADGLHYAHQMGVVHRDVKPDNVLLDRITGRAMLTDFGIAKQFAATESLTQTGVIVGTPHYMSPEQASGERQLDGRSDIYSLGVMSYRMATGRLPFEGSSMRDVLAQHAARDPVPAKHIVPSQPLDLDHEIARALAKDPSGRWSSARAMRDALSPESEDAVPESLQALNGAASRFALLSLSLCQLSVLGYVLGFMDRDLIVATVTAALALPVLGVAAAAPAAKKFGWRVAVTHALRQPSWWTAWWPRIGRRAGDVWDRLPRLVKRFRNLQVYGLVPPILLTNFLFIAMAYHLRTASPTLMRAALVLSILGIGAFFAAFVPMSVVLRRRARPLGLTNAELNRALLEFSGNTAFWRKPHVAALLEPEAAEFPGADVRSPADLLRAIESNARAGASADADIVAEAVAVARGVVAAIDACDTELAQLARDADPRERERIGASIAALGAPGPGESPAKTQMRDLLGRQQLLFDDLDRRRGEVSARRSRMQEQLRTLALQLANLGAHREPGGAAAADITGRIRVVLKEIDYRVQGAEQVRSLL